MKLIHCKFKVDHISDGDTIKGTLYAPGILFFRKIPGVTTIRMFGIDTPEVSEHPKGGFTTRTTAAGEPYAVESAQMTARLRGKKIDIFVNKDYSKDHRGRLLAIVQAWGGKTIQEHLLTAGYAKTMMLEACPPQYRKRFMKAEAYARRRGRGVHKKTTRSRLHTAGVALRVAMQLAFIALVLMFVAVVVFP